jgi:hypothetical protein|eukprot:COSAG01_NODE_1863_length_9037_cov_37.811591_9_plen_68_part_00
MMHSALRKPGAQFRHPIGGSRPSPLSSAEAPVSTASSPSSSGACAGGGASEQLPTICTQDTRGAKPK